LLAPLSLQVERFEDSFPNSFHQRDYSFDHLDGNTLFGTIYGVDMAFGNHRNCCVFNLYSVYFSAQTKLVILPVVSNRNR